MSDHCGNELATCCVRVRALSHLQTVNRVALPAGQGAETAKGPTTGLVVFNPTAASWVEVTDAQGTVLLRRMLAAGEVAGASGALPLSAVVGRADVTRVQVRGQTLDLAPIARDNVARFEVK